MLFKPICAIQCLQISRATKLRKNCSLQIIFGIPVEYQAGHCVLWAMLKDLAGN